MSEVVASAFKVGRGKVTFASSFNFLPSQQEAARAHQLMLTYESNSGKHPPLHSTATIDNIWQTDIRIVQQCIEQTEELLEDLRNSSQSTDLKTNES